MVVLGENYNQDIRDTKEVIKDLLSHCNGMFAVRIQKTLFCADLYSVERYAARVTTAKYIPQMYGAYSKDIRAALDQLENEIPTTTANRKGKPTTRYKYDSSISSETIGRGRKQVISRMFQATMTLSEEDLTEISKDNWLINDAEYDQPLDFQKYSEKIRRGDVEPKLWQDVSIGEGPQQNIGQPNTPEGLLGLRR